MVEETMAKSGSNKFLLDGYPRSLEQAFAFEQQIGPATFCLSLEVADDVMKQRMLSRGKNGARSDDQDESVILKRIQTFHEQSEAASQFYARLGKLKRVSDGTVEEVYAQVRKAFQPRVIFVAGKPGAGKGVQCQRIAARYGKGFLSLSLVFFFFFLPTL